MENRLRLELYKTFEDKNEGKSLIFDLCFRHALDEFNNKEINETLKKFKKTRFDENLFPLCEELANLLVKYKDELYKKTPRNINTFVRESIASFAFGTFTKSMPINTLIFRLEQGEALMILQDPYIYTKEMHPNIVQLDLISNILYKETIDMPLYLRDLLDEYDEPEKQRHITKYEDYIIDELYEDFVSDENFDDFSNTARFLDLIPNVSDLEGSDNSFLNDVIEQQFDSTSNKTCVVYLDKILYALNFESFREYIIKHNYLESVILMPSSNIYSKQTLPYRYSVLLVLDKHKEDDLVKFIDLRKKDYAFPQMLIELESKEVTTKNINDLHEDHFDLSVNKVVKLDSISEELYSPLIDLCDDILRGDNNLIAFRGEKTIIDKNKIYKYINNQMLDEDLIDDEMLIEAYTKTNKEPTLLEDGDLLITAKYSKPKCSILRLKNKSLRVAANGNLFIIRLKEKKLTPYFVKNFLDSQLGLELIDSLAKGQTVKMLKINDLKNLPIPKLDDDKLRKVALESKRLLEEIKFYKEKLAESYFDYQTLSD